jgi:hypothetical protein
VPTYQIKATSSNVYSQNSWTIPNFIAPGIILKSRTLSQVFPQCNPIAKGTMRVVMICLFALLCASTSGCLSLQFSGKTHNCTNSKEAEMRIAQLERRINTLEQYANINPPLPNQTESAVVMASAPLPGAGGYTSQVVQPGLRSQ